MSLFSKLPPELTLNIFELACRPDLEKRQDNNGGGGALYQTILNLSRVSRSFRVLAVPLLYQHVFAAGRTKLSLLARTLQARPELGACVKHLLIADRGAVVGAGKTDPDNRYLGAPPLCMLGFPRRAGGARDAQTARAKEWCDARMQALVEMRASILSIIGEGPLCTF